MHWTDTFTGNMGLTFSYTNIILILLLMSAMSLRLYWARLRRAYLSLTLSFLFVLVHYALLLFFEISGISSQNWSGYVTSLLKVCSFILINLGVFQLYNSTKPKHYVLLTGLFALTVLISLLHFWIDHVFAPSLIRTERFRQIGLDVFLFLLIFLSFYRIPPLIGQSGKYQLGLTFYFLAHIFDLLNSHLFEGKQHLFSFMSSFLPVAYYFTLFLIIFERVVELMQAIYRSSITDSLTGLFNRKYWTQRVAQFVGRNLPVTVLFSDIDNFKKLNDSRGHHKGDDALKKVAQIMKQECELIGIAGRYGGEELVLLVTDPDVDAAELAERIRQRVEKEAGVTVSIGYSRSRKGMSAQTLIRQADEAMYIAKTTGKNKVVKYRKA